MIIIMNNAIFQTRGGAWTFGCHTRKSLLSFHLIPINPLHACAYELIYEYTNLYMYILMKVSTYNEHNAMNCREAKTSGLMYIHTHI